MLHRVGSEVGYAVLDIGYAVVLAVALLSSASDRVRFYAAMALVLASLLLTITTT